MQQWQMTSRPYQHVRGVQTETDGRHVTQSENRRVPDSFAVGGGWAGEIVYMRASALVDHMTASPCCMYSVDSIVSAPGACPPLQTVGHSHVHAHVRIHAKLLLDLFARPLQPHVISSNEPHAVGCRGRETAENSRASQFHVRKEVVKSNTDKLSCEGTVVRYGLWSRRWCPLCRAVDTTAA